MKKHILLFEEFDPLLKEGLREYFDGILKLKINDTQRGLYEWQSDSLEIVNIVPYGSNMKLAGIVENFLTTFKPKTGDCFKMAANLTMFNSDIKYVEGMISYAGVPIDHAWNEYDGMYFDITDEVAFADRGGIKAEEHGKIVTYSTDELYKYMRKTAAYGSYITYYYKDSILNKKMMEDKREENKAGKFEDYSNASGDKYWENMGAGVLPICTSTGRILLGMRSKYVNEPNVWGAFGGKVDEEEGETEGDVINVAEREFNEETKYGGNVELIPSYIYETPEKTFKYYNFLGLIENEFEPVLSWETSHAEWFTLNDLMKIDRKSFHFGLKLLFENDLHTIKKYAR